MTTPENKDKTKEQYPLDGDDEPSKTLTIETGHFTRVKTRKGTETKQKTVYHGKNQKKVVLAELNGLQCYVYPYDFPDKVFIGLGDSSVQLSRYDVNKIVLFYNRMRWYLNGGLKRSLSGNTSSRLEDILKTAYNYGLEDKRGLKK